MEKMSDLSVPEQRAFKSGFLFAMYSEEFRSEDELVAAGHIPYAPGTTEYSCWLKGYQSNLG